MVGITACAADGYTNYAIYVENVQEIGDPKSINTRDLEMLMNPKQAQPGHERQKTQFFENQTGQNQIYQTQVELQHTNTRKGHITQNPLARIWRPKFVEYLGVRVAPMGIAVYGDLTAEAVRGEVDISRAHVVSYSKYASRQADGAFSAQLNAFIGAKLNNGKVRHYLARAILAVGGVSGLTCSIHDMTGRDTMPKDVVVEGRGKIVHLYSPLGDEYRHYASYAKFDPPGRVTLEIRPRVDNGKIVFEFYANGQRYDEVSIKLRNPAIETYVEVSSAKTRAGFMPYVDLVAAGHDADMPWAILRDGRIGLKLYIYINGEWTPPPAAWSRGYVSGEAINARVRPLRAGAVVLEPGEPNSRRLW